jgi:hypothetical protein
MAVPLDLFEQCLPFPMLSGAVLCLRKGLSNFPCTQWTAACSIYTLFPRWPICKSCLNSCCTLLCNELHASGNQGLAVFGRAALHHAALHLLVG